MAFNVHRYPRMVQEYYVDRLRQAREQRLARLASVRSRADVVALQRETRRKIRQSFGRFPRRTALNARTTGTVEHRCYTIEKVLFESRPGFLVSANLYVPKGLEGPAPCVLGTCGHSEDGKAAPIYQSFAQGLALKGFVVLIYDPISQGERVQYPNAEGRCRLGLCPEHNMVGHQQALVGEFFGAWRAWDGTRALDYLLSRPEADRGRVGLTGNSGGGTMTTWLCGLDDRFTMAAPGCFVTTLLANAENELPADVEQIPPRLVKLGLDEADFYVPFAPRPLILLTQENDFFDQRGAQEAYRTLKRLYRLLGAPNNIRIVTGPRGHGYSIELREAMYGFFGTHSGLTVPAKEAPLAIRTQQALSAARFGSVIKAGSRRVLEFTRDRAEALAAGRKRASAPDLRRIVRRRLVLPRRTGPPHYRVLRPRRVGTTTYQFYALETEPGIQAIVTMLAPDGAAFRVPRERRCALLVPHRGAYEDLTSRRLTRYLRGKGRVFGVDPRGVGESMAATCNARDYLHPYDTEYFYNSLGILLGEPYLGRRVHDVLGTFDWLAAHDYREVHLIGRGFGAVVALLAAVVDSRPKTVTLINGLLSYGELTQVPIYRWPASSMIPGALRAFDLPECYRALGRKVRLVRPWNARMRPLRPSDARQRLTGLGLPTSLLAR